MISETRFSKSYSSVWRSLTPTMELFVRRSNMDKYERGWRALSSLLPPKKRAFVNMAAFELFSLSRPNGSAPVDIAAVLADDATRTEVSDRVSKQLGEELTISDDEFSEASELARRMWFQFLLVIPSRLVVRPQYSGCGIVNSCRGDALIDGNHLIEFKDGDRPFRAYEFRQLAIYSALLFNSTGIIPQMVEVVNSRRGVSLKIGMDDFADMVAGEPAVVLLREIVRAMSDLGASA